MKKVTIDFHNMWGGFDKNNNIITNTLRLLYDVKISVNPDISICQVCPADHQAPEPEYFVTKGKNKVVHWMTESIERTGSPDYDRCDFSITSCRFNDEKNIRIPSWSMYLNWINNQEDDYKKGRNQSFLVSPKKLVSKIQHTEKKKFCCLLVNNDLGIRKNDYPQIMKLSIDNGLLIESRGRYLQNMQNLGGDELDKLNYIDSFKFNLCYDNGDADGYITEKLIHPIYKGCIPIYWGCKTVGAEFNEDRFIHARNYSSIEEMWDHIMKLNYNKDMFKEMQSQPCFPNNQIPEVGNPEYIIENLKKIVES